jgi:uncharacterized membrane protein SirB2
MSYMAFKHLHLLAVVLTVVFFVVRSGGVLAGLQWVNKTWMRISHHVIDLVVLISALGLCYFISQWPFYNSGWVTAKLLGLVGYMGFAAFALRRQKITGLVIAAAFLIYTAWVAVNKVPFPGF